MALCLLSKLSINTFISSYKKIVKKVQIIL